MDTKRVKNGLKIYFYYFKMEAVKEYWNRRPCNIKHSNSQFGSKKYFEEVSRRKYLVEPHILEFADFEKYKNMKVKNVKIDPATFGPPPWYPASLPLFKKLGFS